MLAGKYLNGYGKDEEYVTYIPSGWDEGYVVIKGHYFNYTVNENGKRYAMVTTTKIMRRMCWLGRCWTLSIGPLVDSFSSSISHRSPRTTQQLHRRVTKACFPTPQHLEQ